MMAPGLALQALALALAVGEGCTWLALGLVACSLLQNRPAPARPVPVPKTKVALRWLRRSLSRTRLHLRRASVALGGAPVGLGLYAAAGLAAYALGPYGLLRPGALGHCLPVLAWPLVARAARQAPLHERRRALQLFVCCMLVAAVLGAVASAPLRERLQAWVRLDRFVGEQSLRPGSAQQAVGGLYFHRLKMAHVLLLALACPVAIIFVPQAPRRRRLRHHVWVRLVDMVAPAAPWLLLVALSSALAFTFARAAYLAAAVAFMAVWLGVWQSPEAPKRRLIAWAAAGLGVMTVLAALHPELRARVLSSSSTEAAAVRAVIWTEAVTIVWEHPWGIGLGNYPEVVARYYAALDPLTQSPRTDPHSLLWMAWAEGGLVGLFGMALFWARLGQVACKHLTASSHSLAAGPGDGPSRRRAGAALLFATTAVFVVGCTHDVLFHNVVALAFFSGLGFATAALPTAAEAPS